MIRKPWHIWLLFASCLAIVIPAMVWLTLNALKLDKEISLSRESLRAEQQNAALYEQVSNSLRIMDSQLTPLVVEEAIRPASEYAPFQAVATVVTGKEGSKNAGSKGTPRNEGQQDPGTKSTAPASGLGKQPLPSPLLLYSSSFVKLHFEVTLDNRWSSPQIPPTELQSLARAYGLHDQVLTHRKELLNELSAATKYEQLLAIVPETMLPKYVATTTNGQSRAGYAYGGGNLPADEGGQIIDLGLSKLKQQVEQSANQAPQQAIPDAGSTAQADFPSPQSQSPNQKAGVRGNDVQQALEVTQNQVGKNEQVRQQRIQQSRVQLWNQRDAAMQNFALSQMAQKRSGLGTGMSRESVAEGVTRPVWMGSRLILVRRVVRGPQVVVQGCWLDWEKLSQVLLADISGYLRRVQLVPVNDEREVYAERMLATLPVELVVDPEEAKALSVDLSENSADAITAPSSAIRVSLIIAWCCIIAAALSVAGVLQGVVTLSERRGAFVSTVTHELRTPLTTFQMYSEMLSAGMIQDEEKKSQYLETLRIEADRLSHLVENVLQYARLERGQRGKQRQAIEVLQLWQRIESRLIDRAQQAEMEINVDLDPTCMALKVLTDPAAVEQILFNLVDNACKYVGQDSSKEIEIRWGAFDRYLKIRVTDQGPGIPTKKVRYLFRPFSKSLHDPANTAPGVGLGLALCRQLARTLGGELEYDSAGPAGASFVLSLPWASADSPEA